MGTRCQIGIYETQEKAMDDHLAIIYRHQDGYPEGILDEIVDYCKDFDEHRGMGDAEYFAARMTWKICETRQGQNGSPGYLSVGLCRRFAGDIDFFYRIDCDTKKVWAFRRPCKIHRRRVPLSDLIS
jgi:hypothetical protein